MPRRRSRRGIVEVDLNLVLADDDLLGDGFDDPTLLFLRELGPALVEVFRSQDDFFFGKVADLHHVKLGLSGRDFIVKLAESVGPRVVLRAESVFVDHPGLIKLVEFIDLTAQFLALRFKDFEQIGFRTNCDVRPLQVRTDLVW